MAFHCSEVQEKHPQGLISIHQEARLPRPVLLPSDTHRFTPGLDHPCPSLPHKRLLHIKQISDMLFKQSETGDIICLHVAHLTFIVFYMPRNLKKERKKIRQRFSFMRCSSLQEHHAGRMLGSGYLSYYKTQSLFASHHVKIVFLSMCGVHT